MVAMTFEDRPSPPPLEEPESLVLTESPLLQTKLRMPPVTPNLLSRPRLNKQLAVPPNGYLTLLSAPAGFGKTTLVVDWLSRQEYPVAWLTLDEHDNDPVLFWRYVVSAMQRVDARLGLRAQGVLCSPTPVSLEAAVTLLLNDVVAYIPADTLLILVLDDFHWIHNAAVHQTLNYLLQHQPPQLHLVLLTRADPVLSLARLRVEGRLLELRAADLRMTVEEIRAFLTEQVGLDLSEEVVALLAQQTEGWPAGLQLAALSLRQRNVTDAQQLVQSFSGAQPHVFAYLLEEVLSCQPEEMRRFLQQTAVLPQFSAPLCTAVTGQGDAARLLTQLTAEGLFITPLDEQGEWYRYHPLFAEMLQVNLDEATRRECHRRAACWFAEHRLAQDDIRLPAELLLDPLTGRELEILSLIAQGCSNQEIADKLVISVGTVKGHVNHILSKLDAPNRTYAVARARDLSLLDV